MFSNKILVVVIIIGIIILKLFFNLTDSFTDYFDCYLKITDVNPQLINAYMKYNNKHVTSGKCENARLHVTVEPCPTDINNILSKKCNETITLTSSKGNPIFFPYYINPMNVGKYFGI